jgi:hypothetical protein
VAYRPVAKHYLCKQRPLLCNTRNNRKIVFSVVRAAAFSGQQLGKHVPAATDTNSTIEERCFLCGLCRDVIARTVGAMSSVVAYTPDSNEVSAEAEESPLLRVVTKQRLGKTIKD